MIDSLVDCPVRCRDWDTFLTKSVLVWARDLLIDRDGTMQLIPRQSESFWLKYQRVRADSTGIFSQGSVNPDRWSWQDTFQLIPLEFHSVFEAKVEA